MCQVCGSDGVTYDTECHMKKINCLKQKNVTVISHGPCSKQASRFYYCYLVVFTGSDFLQFSLKE